MGRILIFLLFLLILLPGVIFSIVISNPVEESVTPTPTTTLTPVPDTYTFTAENVDYSFEYPSEYNSYSLFTGFEVAVSKSESVGGLNDANTLYLRAFTNTSSWILEPGRLQQLKQNADCLGYITDLEIAYDISPEIMAFSNRPYDGCIASGADSSELNGGYRITYVLVDDENRLLIGTMQLESDDVPEVADFSKIIEDLKFNPIR